MNRFLDRLLEKPCEFLPVPDTAAHEFAVPRHLTCIASVNKRVAQPSSQADSQAQLAPDSKSKSKALIPTVILFAVEFGVAEREQPHAKSLLVLRRFSDFAALRLALRSAFGDSKVALLPPKAFVGEVSLTERERGVEQFAEKSLEQFFHYRMMAMYSHCDVLHDQLAQNQNDNQNKSDEEQQQKIDKEQLIDEEQQIDEEQNDDELLELLKKVDDLRPEFASLHEVDQLRKLLALALMRRWASMSDNDRKKWTLTSPFGELLLAEHRLWRAFVTSERLNREARLGRAAKIAAKAHKQHEAIDDELFSL